MAELAGGVAPRRRLLDPRTALVLVVLVSSTVVSPAGARFVPAALVLGVLLAVTEGAWRRAALLPAVVVVMWLAGWVLPRWQTHPVAIVVALTCEYLIGFAVAIGIGLHLLATTSPTRLSAALRAVHVPRALAVTLAMMLRFFPVVAAEAGAVLDAMRLRGLAGARGLARHPVRSIERFTVPMIAASLRAGEDLSAAAVLRGLGSRRPPTSMDPPRLGAPDLVCLLLVLALVWATLILPTPMR